MKIGSKHSEETRLKMSASHKGKTPPNKGKKHSEETKKKISEKLKGVGLGRVQSEKTKQLRSDSLKKARKEKQWGVFIKGHKYQSWKGKKHSEETKRKISESMKVNNPMKNPEVAKRLSIKLKETGARAGEKSNTWKGGITPINTKIRNSDEYKSWRLSVFQRDKYTCTECNARSCKDNYVYLEAHHILPFATFPEKRFDINNGQTLCKKCHHKKPKGKNIYDVK